MNIIVDENIPRRSVDELRARGHDVRDIRGTGMEGSTDGALWEMALAEKRLLIRTDKWFGTHRSPQHPGVLIVLLKQPNRERIHTRVLKAIERFAEKEWANLVVIVRDKVQSVKRMG